MRNSILIISLTLSIHVVLSSSSFSVSIHLSQDHIHRHAFPVTSLRVQNSLGLRIQYSAPIHSVNCGLLSTLL